LEKEEIMQDIAQLKSIHICEFNSVIIREIIRKIEGYIEQSLLQATEDKAKIEGGSN
jgi:hypothetical protein